VRETPSAARVSLTAAMPVRLRANDETSGCTVSIVMPAYNEVRRLREPLEHVTEVLEQHDAELIVVDDGSTDGTGALARRSLAGNPRARVVRLATNRGKGGAVKAGFSAARGRSIVFMDADLATELTDLPVLLDALKGSEVALGSRSNDETVIEDSTLRRSMMGAQFNRLVRQVTGLPMYDTQCGFKGFRASAGKLLMHLSAIDGFAFDVEVLALADRLGLRSAEVIRPGWPSTCCRPASASARSSVWCRSSP
jgi:glycosyltransferase involved in cell wall biosynthesis